MLNLEDLKGEIEKIKERNARGEADKAWETSFTRMVVVAVSTSGSEEGSGLSQVL